VHVERVGLEGGHAEVGGELLARVDDDRLDRAAVERPLADDLHVLAALADIDGDGDDLRAHLLGEERDGHGGVQATGVCEYDPVSHDLLSPLERWVLSVPEAPASGPEAGPEAGPVRRSAVASSASASAAPPLGSRLITRI